MCGPQQNQKLGKSCGKKLWGPDNLKHAMLPESWGRRIEFPYRRRADGPRRGRKARRRRFRGETHGYAQSYAKVVRQGRVVDASMLVCLRVLRVLTAGR